MGSCIIEKFSYYSDLTDSEKKFLSRLEDNKISFKAGEKIRSKGDAFDDIYIVYDGWAIVSSTTVDDERSIFDFRVDADFVGTSELTFNKRLYDFHAITDTVVCPFPKKHLDEMFDHSSKLRDIFFLILSREQAIMYERIISIGRRTAIERLAHFLLEVSLRYQMIGGPLREKFDFPLNQTDVGDILGLSHVHVSRAMSSLKKNGYITYGRKTVTILDKNKLIKLSNFNPEFLLNYKKDIQRMDDTIR